MREVLAVGRIQKQSGRRVFTQWITQGLTGPAVTVITESHDRPSTECCPDHKFTQH